MVGVPSAETSRSWLESPLWDSLWILSGLWLSMIVLGAHAAGYVPVVPNLLALAAVALLWGGHILSPLVVSWANRELRAHMPRAKWKFIIVPLCLLLASITLGMLGDLSQWRSIPPEVTRHVNPRLLLFYTFLLWNTWHFASQHFGVLSIYRRSAGRSSHRERRWDRTFCVAMTCVLTPLAWYAQDREEIFAQLFSYLPDPTALPRLSIAIIVTAVVVTMSYLIVEILNPKSSLPRGLYVVSIGIQPIFATISYPIYHVAVFSICHWLTALGLASKILRSEVTQVAAAERQVLPWLAATPRRGFAMGILVFALISVGMFLLFHSKTFHDMVGIVAASGHGQESLFAYKTGVFQVAFGVVSGAYFGISFVHFMYDRYVYAFRRPEIREWIAPHLFSPTPIHRIG